MSTHKRLRDLFEGSEASVKPSETEENKRLRSTTRKVVVLAGSGGAGKTEFMNAVMEIYEKELIRAVYVYPQYYLVFRGYDTSRRSLRGSFDPDGTELSVVVEMVNEVSDYRRLRGYETPLPTRPQIDYLIILADRKSAKSMEKAADLYLNAPSAKNTVVCLNKSDLRREDASMEREYDGETLGDIFAVEDIQSVSAKDRTGVESVIDDMINELSEDLAKL